MTDGPVQLRDTIKICLRSFKQKMETGYLMLHPTSGCKTPRTTLSFSILFSYPQKTIHIHVQQISCLRKSVFTTTHGLRCVCSYASRIVTITQVDRRTRHTQQTLILHEP